MAKNMRFNESIHNLGSRSLNKMMSEYELENKKADDQKDKAKLDEFQKVMEYTKIRAQNIENFGYNKSIIESFPKYVQDKCK